MFFPKNIKGNQWFSKTFSVLRADFWSIDQISAESRWNKRRRLFERCSANLRPISNKRRPTPITDRRVVFINSKISDQNQQREWMSKLASVCHLLDPVLSCIAGKLAREQARKHVDAGSSCRILSFSFAERTTSSNASTQSKFNIWIPSTELLPQQ